MKPKLVSLFLAVVLSIGLFSELRIVAFLRFDDGNYYSWFLFTCRDVPAKYFRIPPNWMCRTLSMDISTRWARMFGAGPHSASYVQSHDADKVLIWTPALMQRESDALASYNAIFYFAVCIVLIFVTENPVLPMLGVAFSILMSAPGSLFPYLLPWDMPTMAAWAFIFLIYSRLEEKTRWAFLAFTIVVLGLLKETVLVTALFFIGAPWSWPKRIVVIVAIVVGSQLLNWGLFGARPDWLFSATGAGTANRWNPLMLWPIVLANAGSVVLLPWMLWKKRDWPLAAVCGAFIVLQALNNLACGIYDENRDWLELAPIGWILIGEAWLRPSSRQIAPAR